MRLDQILLSPNLSVRLVDGGVDRCARGQENASDHAPTWISSILNSEYLFKQRDELRTRAMRSDPEVAPGPRYDFQSLIQFRGR